MELSGYHKQKIPMKSPLLISPESLVKHPIN